MIFEEIVWEFKNKFNTNIARCIILKMIELTENNSIPISKEENVEILCMINSLDVILIIYVVF